MSEKMDKILKRIKTLTRSDFKNLQEKALKTAEEVGELAKAILPYVSAYSTSHKFVSREKILEEACDTIICALSVAYDIKATDEEIMDMLATKCDKWSLIQLATKSVEGLIPFENHVTVRTNKISEFKQACAKLDVKAVVLDLQTQDGDSVFHDVMTSHKFTAKNNREAFDVIERTAEQLTLLGFEVVRRKIETVPWHPAAPSEKNGQAMPANCYFESHFNVITTTDRLAELRELSKKYNCHLSKNVFKVLDNGLVQIMSTLRSYHGTAESFIRKVDEVKSAFLFADFKLEKEIVEFSIYDTKVSHDVSWIKN